MYCYSCLRLRPASYQWLISTPTYLDIQILETADQSFINNNNVFRTNLERIEQLRRQIAR